MSISGSVTEGKAETHDRDLNILLEKMRGSHNDEERKLLEKQLLDRMSIRGAAPLLQVQGKDEQGKDKYQVTFLYQAKDVEKVELDSDDLYERMLDENDKPKRFERIPGTDTFVLQLDNLPEDAFCFYNIKVNGEVIFPKHDSKKTLALHTVENATSEEYQRVKPVSHETLYLQLPKASIPPWTAITRNSSTRGKIRKDSIKDRTNTFVDRDIWIYKPKDFNPIDGKVIFMLDGESFMKSLTPYLDAMSKNEDNPFANTAIVFVDSKLLEKSKKYAKPYPDRVHEFYYETDKFSQFLTDQVIPKYCDELWDPKLYISNPDNVILAAHSLAAYPVINVAKAKPGKIGGVILLSPALNQKKEHDLPENPPTQLRELPIYMQIGQLESEKPPKICQDPEYKDMTDESRLKANQDFHTMRENNNYNIEFKEHSSGHDAIHVIDGLEKGLHFVDSCRKDKRETIQTSNNPETKQHSVKTLVKQYQTYIDQNKQEKKEHQTDISDSQDKKSHSRPK
ncbi:MAG: hypothetical protein HYX61_09690 [Gammaproteobacteria bacterium]|jgi:predicted alpha/beta superfamily hydrolase|nr:hypothetical protein [Gammaproteobacteria bacterium]